MQEHLEVLRWGLGIIAPRLRELLALLLIFTTATLLYTNERPGKKRALSPAAEAGVLLFALVVMAALLRSVD